MGRIRRLHVAVIALLVAAGLFAAPTPAQATAIAVTGNHDTIAADGFCTLREAVVAANTNAAVNECTAGEAGLDVINLQATTYNIATAAAAGDTTGVNGDLDVIESVTINGAGSGSTILDGSVDFRVFEVNSGSATLTISGVKITGAQAMTSGPDGCRGAAIAVTDGDLVVNDSILTGNVAGEGGAIYAAGNGVTTLNNVQVTGNNGHKNGGAIATAGAATLNIIDSDISTNTHIGQLQNDPPCQTTPSNGGGAIYITGTGGGTIANSTIAGNAANSGGVGGGIYAAAVAGTVNIVRSTVSGNSAPADGAIHVGSSSTTEITNSTISGNTSAGTDGIGVSGTLKLKSTTISGHDFGVRTDIGQTTEMQNTIMDDPCLGDAPVSLGHNMDIGTTCGFGADPTDQESADAVLSALLDNGGPTLTHKPGAAGSAIDAGDCPSLGIDQRGFPRPAGAACDVGAVESTPPSAAITFPAAQSYTSDGYQAGCGGALSDICGTALPGLSGDAVGLVEIQIQRVSDNQFWNVTGFQPTAPADWIDATGTTDWTYQFVAPEDGYVLSVRATDIRGYVGSPTTLEFDVDDSPPAAAITFPASGAYTTGAYEDGCTPTIGDLCGTAVGAPPGDSVQRVELQIQRGSDDDYWNGTSFQPAPAWVVATGTTNWTHDFVAVPDTYELSARAVDGDGSIGALATSVFSIDDTVPGAPVVTPKINKKKNRATFTFTAEPGATFHCKLDGAAFAPCTTPKTYKKLKERRHTFQVRAVDAAGNIGAPAAVRFRV